MFCLCLSFLVASTATLLASLPESRGRTLLAHTGMAGGLPLPTTAAGEGPPSLARSIRRLPADFENEIGMLSTETVERLFGGEFASMAEAGGEPAAPVAAAVAEERTVTYLARAWALPAAKRWALGSIWYNQPARAATRDEREIPPELFGAVASLRAECGSDKRFGDCARLLLRYADNVLAEPTNLKFRSVRSSAKAFSVLAPRRAAPACLEALGFARDAPKPRAPPAAAAPECEGGVCTLPPPAPPPAAAADAADAATDDVAASYTLRESALGGLPLCAAFLRRELRAAELRPTWPATLHPALSVACALLPSELLEHLSAEVTAPHFQRLLEHQDNLARMEQAIGAGPPAAEALVTQLAKLRANVTSAAREHAAAQSGAGKDVGEGRVVAIASAEQWYDLLMDSSAGLVVADFGAPWCGACQAVAPLFAALSMRPEFEGKVTFAYLDAEVVPQLMGDNQVDSFPTFKFFRESEEEELPVVGGDIDAVEAIILALIGE